MLGPQEGLQCEGFRGKSATFFSNVDYNASSRGEVEYV